MNITKKDIQSVKDKYESIECSAVFSKRLKELRELVGFSQSELAEILSVSRTTIGYYESNERTPDINFLYKVKELFGVSYEYLTEKYNIVSIGTNAPPNAIDDYNRNYALLNLSDEAITIMEENDCYGDFISLFIANEYSKDFFEAMEYYALYEDNLTNKFDLPGNKEFPKFVLYKYLSDILDQIKDIDKHIEIRNKKLKRSLSFDGYKKYIEDRYKKYIENDNHTLDFYEKKLNKMEENFANKFNNSHIMEEDLEGYIASTIYKYFTKKNR